jgi:flagellar hook-associated protein 2
VTSASNAITGAIAGVTLSLQHAEPGTTIEVAVERNADAAVQAVQAFATAFNGVAAFVQEQSAGGALAHNGTLRSTMQQLKQALLTDQAGLADGAAFARGALVGVALTRAGTLEVDAERLKAALASSPADVRALFASAGAADASALSYLSAGAATKAGRYAVRVDALPTAAALTGAGFGGAYAVAGPADALRVTDAGGRAATIELRDGDGLAAIVERLNAELRRQGVRAEAAEAGGQLRLLALDVGSAACFEAAFVPGTAGNADQLGLAGSHRGTDVAGTIGGRAATGTGWTLTSAEGDAAGLAVTYGGTTTGDVGTLSYALGVGGTMARLTDLLTRAGDGTIATQTGSIEQSVEVLQRRADDVQARLDRRRETLTAQFTAMEAALSRITAQGDWLTQQLRALQGSKD